MINAQKKESYIRNFIFGVEDSLVSTLGLLSGIATAGIDKSEIFLTGVVLIFVEATSMGIGSYLSQDISEDFLKTKNSQKSSVQGAIIMLLAYFFSGFIPLTPYLVFNPSKALPISIAVSLTSLFFLGSISSKFLKINSLKHAIKMFLLGGTAVLIGITVGKIFKY